MLQQMFIEEGIFFRLLNNRFYLITFQIRLRAERKIKNWNIFLNVKFQQNVEHFLKNMLTWIFYLKLTKKLNFQQINILHYFTFKVFQEFWTQCFYSQKVINLILILQIFRF